MKTVYPDTDCNDAVAVSVVIPCYNGARFLPQTVESVIHQTFKNIEIIIVDDASHDDTLEVATELARKYADNITIKVFNQTHMGISKTRNNGITVASGKYIMPLDQDDLIKPDYIEEAVAVIEQDENIGVVSAFHEFFGGKIYRCPIKTRKKTDLRRMNYLVGCSLYRREAWEKAGGYNPEVDGYEDWNFWIGIAERGYEIRQIEKHLFMWRYHDSNTSHRVSRQKFDLIYRIRCLHPYFFAPVISNIFGPAIAKKYFKALIPVDKTKSLVFNRIIYPAYFAYKQLSGR